MGRRRNIPDWFTDPYRKIAPGQQLIYMELQKVDQKSETLIETPGNERQLAFKRIEQAIRQEDLWGAAWYTAKFLRKLYTMTVNEKKWILSDYHHRVGQLEAAVDQLLSNALSQSQKDFTDWFKEGLPFTVIEQRSYAEHYQSPETNRILRAIATHGRAAAYLKGIIEMGTTMTLPIVDKSGEGMELQGMGAWSGNKFFKSLELEEDDWVMIRKEEAATNDNTQWTVSLENSNHKNFV